MDEFNLERDSSDYCVTIKLKEKGLVVYILERKSGIYTSIPFGDGIEIDQLGIAIQERKIFIEEKRSKKDKEVLRIEVLIIALEAGKGRWIHTKSIEIIDKEIEELNAQLKDLENE